MDRDQEYEYVVRNVWNSQYLSDWDINDVATRGYRLVSAIPYTDSNYPGVTGVALIYERLVGEE